MKKRKTNKKSKVYATIYTDASFDTSTGSGYGGFVIQSKTVSIQKGIYLGIVQDSNYSELVTILKALREAVRQHRYKLQGVLLYSDSRVAIESIESNLHPKYATISRVIDAFVNKYNLHLKFKHVESHIPEMDRSLQHAINDKCDKMARDAKYN